MHTTQKFILVQLMGRESAKFSDLKPGAMEGSKFTYHLKQLQDNDLVVYDKDTKNYKLSSDGRMLADRFDADLLDEASQPVIVVLVALKRSQNEWLLAERHIQPAFGKKGFPHVRVVLGTQFVEQSERALLDLTGIKSSLSYKGHAYITQYRNQELESSVLAHLLCGSYLDGEIVNLTDDYTFSWVKNPDWKHDSMIPSNGDMIRLAESDGIFFDELVYYL